MSNEILVRASAHRHSRLAPSRPQARALRVETEREFTLSLVLMALIASASIATTFVTFVRF